MTEYVIHQHHHYGWTKRIHEAENENEAKLKDILKDHDWLPEYEYSIKFTDDGYSVTYEGEPRWVFGGTQYKGDHWFADQMRVGELDDCDKCGGTGVNHYYSWCQCWKCGEMDKTSKVGYKDGRSSGKMKVE